MQPSRLRVCTLALPGVTEQSILDRSVFKVRGKAFATENWPEEGWAVVKLSLVDQKRLCAASMAIQPEGERGATGVTLIRLTAIDDEMLTEALTAAWRLAYGADAGGAARTPEAGVAASARQVADR